MVQVLCYHLDVSCDPWKTVVFMCSLHCLSEISEDTWDSSLSKWFRHELHDPRGPRNFSHQRNKNCKLPADLTDQHRCHKLRFSHDSVFLVSFGKLHTHMFAKRPAESLVCYVLFLIPQRINGAHTYFLNCSVLLGTVSSPYLHLWMCWFRMAKPGQTFSQKILLSEPVSRTAMFRSNFCAAVRLSEAEVWQERIARMGFLEDVDSRQVVFNMYSCMTLWFLW